MSGDTVTANAAIPARASRATAQGPLAQGALTQGALAQGALAQGGASERKLREAAQRFEGMAIGALLQPMFETLKTNGTFGGGAGEDQWKPMMVDEIAKSIAKAGGLGLAEPVYRAMLQAQEGKR